MKETLQLILKTLDEQYDATVPTDRLKGKTDKEKFMLGAVTALIIVNGLDFIDVKETKP